MPLRHGQRLVAPIAPNTSMPLPCKTVAHQGGMALARDLVEDHAGDRRRRRDSAQSRARPRRPIAPAPRHRAPAPPASRSPRRYRRSSHCPRRRAWRRRRTVPSRPRRAQSSASAAASSSASNRSRAMRPGIQVERRPAGGDGMEGRIDIVRSAFIGLHHPATAAQRGEQRQRQRGLAAAAGGRGDDQSACVWRTRRARPVSAEGRNLRS